ncbi:MAG: S49 family peptidase [Proteobacteria bacterium]|nr:S49 family peptidase [Pseudomonadota bacterium]
MNKKYSILATEVYGKPWLITPAAYQQVCDVAARLGDPEAVLAKRGESPDESQNMEIRGSVAIIHVTGPIIRYASMFSRISGVCSVDGISSDLTLAEENPSVRSIIMHYDTPGGQATGINEHANRIFAARAAGKPIIAYVGGQCASAGYWPASACAEVVIDATAMVGCIGVVFRLQKPSADQNVIEIVSERSPKKRPDLNSEDGQAQIRSWANDLCDVFIASVARFRGVSEETVEADFGGGDILIGEKAVSAGLADRIGSLEGLIAELNAQPPSSGSWTAQSGKHSTQEVLFMNPDDLKQKHPETYATIHALGMEAGKAAVNNETTAAIDQAKADASATELARIKGVLALDKSKKTELSDTIVKLALDGATTPEAAAYKLMTEQGEVATKAAQDLAADAAQIPVIDSGSGAADTEGSAAEAKAVVDNIVAGAGR